MRQDICAGVPSCDPLLQHELLKAVRHRIPHAYARAGEEFGLTVARTQELLDRRVEIVSAARAIRLARMIAYEPDARDVIGEAGEQIFRVLCQNFPTAARWSVRHLPRPMRSWLAMTWTRKIAHGFAGSANRIYVARRDHGAAVTILDGLFSDRLDTLGCAHTYYRQIFEAMFQQVAFMDCQVTEVRRSRVHLNRCSFEIVWKA
jgi:bacteriochlorophyll 4-vinyl reductase